MQKYEQQKKRMQTNGTQSELKKLGTNLSHIISSDPLKVLSYTGSEHEV